MKPDPVNKLPNCNKSVIKVQNYKTVSLKSALKYIKKALVRENEIK